MSAKAYSVRKIREELDRLTAGGDMDRATCVRWLTLACEQLEDWQAAYYGAQEERTSFAQQLTDSEEVIAAVAMVCDVMRRACHGELTAHKPIECARDSAPFRNIMAAVYGLGSCGEELPKKRTRRTAGKS